MTQAYTSLDKLEVTSNSEEIKPIAFTKVELYVIQYAIIAFITNVTDIVYIFLGIWW